MSGKGNRSPGSQPSAEGTGGTRPASGGGPRRDDDEDDDDDDEDEDHQHQHGALLGAVIFLFTEGNPGKSVG